jgi:hypothetical protein
MTTIFAARWLADAGVTSSDRFELRIVYISEMDGTSRRPASFVGLVDVSAGSDQQLQHLLVRVCGGHESRRQAVCVGLVDVGTGGDQQLQHLLVRVRGGIVSRRHAVCVGLIHVGAGFDEQANDIGIRKRACDVERLGKLVADRRQTDQERSDRLG